jgi:hypothetical protein
MTGRRLTNEERHARLEDLQFMVDTGETLTGACHRLGLNKEALDKWCRGNDCLNLYQRLQAREHVDQERIRKHDNRLNLRRTAA